MTKAILELPKMPESCTECMFKECLNRTTSVEVSRCIILHKMHVPGSYCPAEGRQADCPLKPVEENAIAAWNSRTGNDIVVRGEWKLYGNDDDLGMSYWCTACNFQLSEDLFYSGYKDGRWIENGVFKYCPNCGAKMEVE